MNTAKPTIATSLSEVNPIKSPRRLNPAYKIWKGIKARCFCKTNGEYHRYGARGISVCERWKNSFPNFLQDMGERPAGTSIERIDGNGHYEPSNCKWANPSEQARNRRGNKWFSYNGKTMLKTDWAKELGVHWKTISKRIKNGWPLHVVLATKKLKPFVNHLKRQDCFPDDCDRIATVRVQS